MKIAYLTNTRFPSERAHAAQIAHMCHAFSRAGNEVTLYTNARGEGTLEAVKKMFGFVPEFTLKTLPPSQLYGETKVGFVVREVLLVFGFWWRYRKVSFEVLYSRDEWVLFLLSFLMPHAPMVFESHEAKYNRAVQRLLKRDVKLIVISEGIRDFYLKNGVPTMQMLVAHDAIDDSFLEQPISRIEARDKLGLSHKKFIAMYIGGFDVWKGVETFFKASELATGVTFVAIGGKDEELNILKNKYPHVNFLGPSHYRDLRFHQRAADVLVIPNSALSKLGAEYTSPLKLFAHLASGVPIVASAVPSIQNVVTEHDVTFFTPDDPAALADVLSLAISTPGSLPVYARVPYTWRRRAEDVAGFLKN